MVVGGFVGAVGLVAAAITALSAALMRRAWGRAARDLHLTLEPGRWPRRPTIHGRIGDAEIRVATRGVPKQATIVEVAGLGRYPCDVLLTTMVPGALDGSPTGDLAFDREVFAGGPAHRVLAMLNRQARAVVRGCVVAFPGARIRTHSPPRETEVELEIPRIVDDARTIVQAVRNVLAVAQAISLGTRTIPDALADNACDEMSGVRERCLAAMVDEYGRSALTDAACRTALADESIDVRLAAARGLRHEPEVDAMLERIVVDAAIDPERRVLALVLRLRAPIADVGPLLERLLDERASAVRHFAMGAIGSRRWLAALDRLLAIAAHPPEADVAVLATTLGQLGDARAQPILLRWLEREGEPQVAAVTALGRVGDVEAIPALEPLTRGILAPPTLKAVARDAIRAIQARLGPADAGRLSLVDLDESAGELGMTDDASGRVSLPPA
jgi:hypothetical protein